MTLVGVLGWFGSETVGQLFSESEWSVLSGSAHQVPHASCTPLLQHQPAGVLSSRLLLCSLLRPLSLQPSEGGGGEGLVIIRGKFNHA